MAPRMFCISTQPSVPACTHTHTCSRMHADMIISWWRMHLVVFLQRYTFSKQYSSNEGAGNRLSGYSCLNRNFLSFHQKIHPRACSTVSQLSTPATFDVGSLLLLSMDADAGRMHALSHLGVFTTTSSLCMPRCTYLQQDSGGSSCHIIGMSRSSRWSNKPISPRLQ